MQDLRNTSLYSIALNLGTISTNTTTNGNTIDMAGYNALTFIISTGNITDGTYVPNIQGSNDNGATWTNLNSTAGTGEIIGTYANATLTATSDNIVKTIGVASNYRYYRIQLVSTGVTTGGILGVVADRSSVNAEPTIGN